MIIGDLKKNSRSQLTGQTINSKPCRWSIAVSVLVETVEGLLIYPEERN